MHRGILIDLGQSFDTARTFEIDPTEPVLASGGRFFDANRNSAKVGFRKIRIPDASDF